MDMQGCLRTHGYRGAHKTEKVRGESEHKIFVPLWVSMRVIKKHLIICDFNVPPLNYY
jgi:hypothetical protein